MNKTKIEWCGKTWNPVTGCFHGCEYCYAAGIARRFGGADGCQDVKFIKNQIGMNHPLVELNTPVYRTKKNGEKATAPYPYGFIPTFHKYKLSEPQKLTKPDDIFVCSMADLFGEWVPVQWIRDVVDACSAAPHHRYLFLTKNPNRYNELNQLAMLPYGDRFWYGSSVTDKSARGARSVKKTERKLKTFWSMEPLLEPVNLEKANGRLPDWVIIGAETGNRKGKVIPRREWVEDIARVCADNDVPVFYKDSLRKRFPDLPKSEFPWGIKPTGKH